MYEDTTVLLDVGECRLPDIQHGSVVTIDSYGNADATVHGKEIRYECVKGYVNGTDVPRCNNGTWTAEALCKPGIYSGL